MLLGSCSREFGPIADPYTGKRDLRGFWSKLPAVWRAPLPDRHAKLAKTLLDGLEIRQECLVGPGEVLATTDLLQDQPGLLEQCGGLGRPALPRRRG